MREQQAAVYAPLATERTKGVVWEMEPGHSKLIDLINVAPSYYRKVVHAWVVVDELGSHLLYSQVGRNPAVEIIESDQMRLTVEEPPDLH